MDNSTVAITKEYLAKLHELADLEKRSTRAELEWMIDARLKHLVLIGATSSEEVHDES